MGFNILNVDYHITDRCNLKCKSCNHFCPLVGDDVKHKPIEQIKADLYLLSKFRDNINQITLLGGEPTLHPNLLEIIEFARSIFPFNDIVLTTNGTTYKEFHKWFEILKKNRIIVCLSIYPYKENYWDSYNTIINLMGEENCRIYDTEGKFQTKPLSNEIISSAEESLQCRMRNYCCQLKEGKLYICNYAAQINYLKDYFGDEIKIETLNDDYVDLNNCTIEDIEHMNVYSTPSICAYCKECNRWSNYNMEYVDWDISEKNINEWIE